MVFLWIFFGVGGRMGAIFQIKRFFDLKKLLFILPLIFCFSLSFGGISFRPNSVCEMPNGNVNSRDLNLCQCWTQNSSCEIVSFDCTKCSIMDCARVNGSDHCYGTPSQACVSVGSHPHGYWTRPNYTFSCTLPDGSSVEGEVERNVIVCDSVNVGVQKIFIGLNGGISSCDDTGSGSGSGTGTNSGGGDNSSNDPPQADQKKVCSGGECKCYNLTTGKEEPCIGGNNSGGGSNSSGDNDSGSGNTGTGSGSGSGDSGNGQGAGSESSPSSGNGTNSGAGGDNSGTGTGSNNGDNSGGGTHTGSSGNQHGGGGTGFGGGSTGGNNGSDNGSEDGKEDGSEDGDDYCLKNPKSVVCNGEPKQGDFDDIVIPRKEVNDSWVKDMFLPDNGTCPAPKKANFLGKTISISYEPLCKLLVQVRFAILLLFAYISARLGLGGKL